MTNCTIARKLFAATLAFIFIISGSAPASLAQRGRTRTRASETAQSPVVHKLPAGTKRQRPPRTFDVLHYAISTRFDMPNKMVIGDETVMLKPLSNGFKSFELDASSTRVEAVTLSGSNATL